MKFSDFAQINPKVKLKKGESYPFIEMEDLTPGLRYASATKEKVFKGEGSRFKTDDIIFARITPCLEHGKIAQVKGKENEKFFGSTEFFVFRAKDGVSEGSFLFYLSYSDILRKPAEKSMYGASGRQRASIEVVKAIEVPNIPFETQHKIAAILSAYDDLIENNTRRIQILEEMAQRIYQEWFVNFRFPGHEKVKFIDSELGKIPEGWEVSTLENIAELVKNKFVEAKHNNLPLLDLARIPRRSLVLNKFGKNDEIKTSRIVFKEDEILFGAIRPYFHKVIITPCDGVTNTSVFVIRNKDGIGKYFLFSLLFSDETVAWATQYASGTKMPVISWEVFKKMKVIIPQREIVENFELAVGKIFLLIKTLNLQNIVLRTTRDLLLPKLISGELDVSNLDIIERSQMNHDDRCK